MEIEPPRPDFADPDPIDKPPEFPELAVPVLKIIIPLCPLEPLLAVEINMIPLVDLVLTPLIKVISPPVEDEVRPALRNILPPTPLFPDPTLMEINPPLPEAADPVPKNILPLFPELEVPVLSMTFPLLPDLPALAVRS